MGGVDADIGEYIILNDIDFRSGAAVQVDHVAAGVVQVVVYGSSVCRNWRSRR